MRALGNRIMYGISRVSTVTPHALVASALLAHRRRGITAREVGRPDLAPAPHRRRARSAPLSKALLERAVRSRRPWARCRTPCATFCTDGLVRSTRGPRARPSTRWRTTRRAELSFYKNTLMNLVAGREPGGQRAARPSLRPAPSSLVKQRALFLSRLFKFEFIYRVGASFDTIFAETVAALGAGAGCCSGRGRHASRPAEPARTAAAGVPRGSPARLPRVLPAGGHDALEARAPGREKKVLRQGDARDRAGPSSSWKAASARPSPSRAPTSKTRCFLLDQGYLVEKDKAYAFGPAGKDEAARREAGRRHSPARSPGRCSGAQAP